MTNQERLAVEREVISHILPMDSRENCETTMKGEKGVSSPSTTPKKLKFEQLRADYELFLQTFEKPTWVYRLLLRRHQISPFMLHRNLSYLKGRATNSSIKQQDKRKQFKIDNMLSNLKSNKENIDDCEDEEKENFLNLSFGGFFHGPGFAEEIFLTNDPKVQSIFKDDFVHVSLDLIQILNRRKKDTFPMKTTHLGQCKAPWNPRTQIFLPGSTMKVTIPPSVFEDNGKSIRTHVLSITVSLDVPKKKRKKNARPKQQKDENVEDMNEPPAKRLKSNGDMTDDELEQTEKMSATFTAELIVYDRHKTCLLTDGDYELLLHTNQEATENGTRNLFESQFEQKLGPFTSFSFGPTIKFSLEWSTLPSVPIKNSVFKKMEDAYIEKFQPLADALSNSENTATTTTRQLSKEKLPRVYYQFIYSNSTRQQTEAREGTSCPWCNLNCLSIYGLLRHLKGCHSRFSFLYTTLKKGHRIDVCINDAFEGTLGFDGLKDIGFIDIDNAPIKRKPTTEVLVARPYRHKEDLREFTEPNDDDYDGAIPMKGHQRTYFHSTNNQHITHLCDFNANSEDELAPDWLKDKTQDMIEEFTDVNNGEKMLMKMWNSHVLKNGYVADFAVAAGCETFVKEYGPLIIEKNLVRNFLVHLNNLLEFQIITQTQIINAMEVLRKLRE